MSRVNYHKNMATERKMGKSGLMFEPRKPKEVSRPHHKPKGLRKVIKSEKIMRKKK